MAEAPGKRPVQDRKLIESAPGLEVVPEFLYTWLGLSKIGAIVVPINASFKENEAQYILSHSEAVAVVAGSHLISIVEAVKRSTPHLQRFVSVGETVVPDWIPEVGSIGV